MAVFVLDKRGKPLMPCSEKRARLLLSRERARVHRIMPIVIRLVDRNAESCVFQPVRVKLDPGSRHTGIAVVREHEAVDLSTGEIEHRAVVLDLMRIDHRGRRVSDALAARRAFRRRRRGNLRYRAPRFNNRTRPAGWLAPSLQHRVDTTLSWVKRFRRWAPVTALSSELVRFDMQALESPEIEGVQYQQGTLAGYEVREYLLERWGRQCAYCDATDVPLQIEHIHPRAAGGSNRASNLTLACAACNQRKAALPIEVFLADQPNRLAKIVAHAKRPLADAAAVNATRWALAGRLRETSLPLELASGGRTKFNRSRLGIPKSHALDAACVGTIANLTGWHRPALGIKAVGRGSYTRTRLDRFGFPRGYLIRQKRVHGFQTGDHVTAVVTNGKKVGTHTGWVAIRASGSFNIRTTSGVVQGIGHRCCRVLQRADGYAYTQIANPKKGNAGLGTVMPSALSLRGLNAGVTRANG